MFGTWPPIVALKARCHSKLLTALAGMNYTRKKWCSWSAFVIPMHESTKELHRRQQASLLQRNQVMLNDRENILSPLRQKPLKIYEIIKRANVVNEEACQSLLLKMRDEGLVKFDIHKVRWLVG